MLPGKVERCLQALYSPRSAPALQTGPLSACLNEIQRWLNSNFVKLNIDKTDIVIIGTPTCTKYLLYITCDIDSTLIKPFSTVRHLGIIFHPSLSFKAHINSVSKLGFFHLRRIARLRPFITHEDTETLVHAFISSRLLLSHYCFFMLRYIQNSAAWLLTHTKRSAHITPVLSELHWLPDSFHIKYKIILLTVKSLHGLKTC